LHQNWPASSVQTWPIARLKAYANNARTHSDAQIDQIAASMKEWGWTNPVLADEEGQIIAGHGRVLAARRLGIAEVPVMVAKGWSPGQKKAYVIADNRLALNAGWDEKLLAVEFGELQQLGFDFELTGFTDAEIAELLTGVKAGLTDANAAPALPAVPVSRAGDLWHLGSHVLACGDATQIEDVKAALGPVRPHLMVTDPPYGVEYDPKWRAEAGINKNRGKMGEVANDDKADWTEAWRLFRGAVVYVWHAGKFASLVQASLERADFEIRSQIIWAKERFALSRGHYHWQHEPCWYGVRAKASASWSGDRSQSTLWKIAAREDNGHSHGTQKPVDCMRRPMENSSSQGQAVYDPFCGTGTSIIAAEQIGRCCHALEISPGYVDVAVRRWQDFTGRLATLGESERTFGDVEAERHHQAKAA
jgi:DNA modification methylase